MIPFILGVAGGSGSGKTYFAKALQHKLNEKHGATFCSILSQDHYYIDQSHRFDGDGGSVNFDHPDSLEFNLLADHLKLLKSGQGVDIPHYDFKTHRREDSLYHQVPSSVIIVDGILVLDSIPVRQLFDESVFFDTPESIRFARRLERDVIERGRTPEGVRKQFESQVAPMHELFVAPSKLFATHVVSNLDDYKKILENYTLKWS